MNELIQRVKDWYVTGPRDFYRRYIENFSARRNLIAVSGDHGFLDMNPLPLGYSELTREEMNATRRQFDRTARELNLK